MSHHPSLDRGSQLGEASPWCGLPPTPSTPHPIGWGAALSNAPWESRFSLFSLRRRSSLFGTLYHATDRQTGPFRATKRPIRPTNGRSMAKRPLVPSGNAAVGSHERRPRSGRVPLPGIWAVFHPLWAWVGLGQFQPVGPLVGPLWTETHDPSSGPKQLLFCYHALYFVSEPFAHMRLFWFV